MFDFLYEGGTRYLLCMNTLQIASRLLAIARSLVEDTDLGEGEENLAKSENRFYKPSSLTTENVGNDLNPLEKLSTLYEDRGP